MDHDRTAGGEIESRSRYTGSANLDRLSKWELIGRWMKLHEEPRSTRDRGSIARRSWLDRAAIVAYSSPDRTPWRRNIKAPPRRHRSMPTISSRAQKSGGMINIKRGEIATIGGDSAAKLKPRRLKLMAHDRARSWPSIPLHDRVKRPEISGLIFSLKPCILPSFVLQLLIDS